MVCPANRSQTMTRAAGAKLNGASPTAAGSAKLNGASPTAAGSAKLDGASPTLAGSTRLDGASPVRVAGTRSDGDPPFLAALLAGALLLLATTVLAADTALPFDSRSLVEVSTLAGLPKDVTAMIGWHKTGTGGMADANEKFNATDVVDPHLPQRHFLAGGASHTTALVAYEQGGRSLTTHVAAFMMGVSGWSTVGEWTLNKRPYSLRQVTRILDSKHYPYMESSKLQLISNRMWQTQPRRRDGPLRELNLSDNEVREIQAVVLQAYPGSILNISGVVTGCPCEEGPMCTDQVWVVAHNDGHTNGLQLSRVGGLWTVGMVQRWWTDYQRVLDNRNSDRNAWYVALEEMQNKFPACPETTPGATAASASPP
jgi:hypothetical protein